MKDLANDWRAYLKATDAVGYLDPIPVQNSMIIREFLDLEIANTLQILDEYETGISPFAGQELQIAA